MLVTAMHWNYFTAVCISVKKGPALETDGCDFQLYGYVHNVHIYVPVYVYNVHIHVPGYVYNVHIYVPGYVYGGKSPENHSAVRISKTLQVMQALRKS